MKLHYLHVIVPQGEEAHAKKESLFQELLVNLQNIIKNKVISLEYFGFDQYTYCYIIVPDDLLETVEGLFYSSYPDCDIRRTKDYTLKFHPESQAIAGTTLKFRFRDVYSAKSYDDFAEDSQSNLFSVVSKIATNEQVWVQVVINPKEESAWYHFSRNWAMRFARWRQFFHIRDRMRAKSEEGIHEKRKKIAQAKYALEPYDAVIRCAYIAKDAPTAKRKLEAVLNSLYQLNATDIQEFIASGTTTGPGFAELYRKRSISGSSIMGVK